MTLEDAVEWWSTVLDSYVDVRLDMNIVEQDFMNRATIRTGAKQLFDRLLDHDIPTVILSAGVTDAIDLWSREYDIAPTLVISNDLILDADRRVIGWNKDSLVHTLNKSETDHAELNAIRRARPLSIVIGDSIHDADMADGDNDVLRIRIYDPRPDEESDIEIVRAETLQRFDIMIESGSLSPIEKLINEHGSKLS